MDNTRPLPQNAVEFAAEEREHLHDLSNPLAIATGMLEALREDFAREGVELTESQERKFTKTQAALDRIGALIAERRARMKAIQGAK